MTDNTSADSGATVMTAKEVADMLGIHHTTLYEAVKRGEIPARRVGRRFIFERQALLDWLRAPVTS